MRLTAFFFRTRPPKRWSWFATFCALNAILFLSIAGIAIVSLLSPDWSLQVGSQVMYLSAGDLIAISLPFAVIYAIGPILPRQPWAWYYNLAIILLGITTFYLFPFAILALVAWLNDDIKRYYGYEPQGPQTIRRSPRHPQPA